MGRVQYDDDPEWGGKLWAGWFKSAVYGKRGQALLRELEEALLAMPQKRLIRDEWASGGGVCALGALDAYRRTKQGIPWDDAVHQANPGTHLMQVSWVGEEMHPHEIPLTEWLGNVEFAHERLGLTFTLAWEIIEKNDERFYHVSPEARWERMLAWVREHIKPVAVTP